MRTITAPATGEGAGSIRQREAVSFITWYRWVTQLPNGFKLTLIMKKKNINLILALDLPREVFTPHPFGTTWYAHPTWKRCRIHVRECKTFMT